MLTDQFESRVRSNLGYRVQIVAAEENAEVDELIFVHAQSFQNFVKVNLQDGLFPLFTECEMPQQDGCVEA